MRMIFQFEGGFLDGKVIAGPHAWRFAYLTDGGAVGARFRDHPDNFNESNFLGPAKDALLEGGVELDWLCKWAAHIEHGKWTPETANHKLAEYLNARGIQKPSSDLINGAIEELAAAGRRHRGEVAQYLYQVVSREETDREIRVRVVLVSKDTTSE